MDETLSPEKRTYVYRNWFRVERHMRSCHEPHLMRPYLANMDDSDPIGLDPEGRNTSLLNDGHVLAITQTTDKLYF